MHELARIFHNQENLSLSIYIDLIYDIPTIQFNDQSHFLSSSVIN